MYLELRTCKDTWFTGQPAVLTRPFRLTEKAPADERLAPRLPHKLSLFLSRHARQRSDAPR